MDRLFALRPRAEQWHSIVDGGLPYKRMIAYRSTRQLHVLVGMAIGQNALARYYFSPSQQADPLGAA